MPRPACANCNVEMVTLATGVIVEEMRSADEPYRIWAADTIRCPICECTIVLRYGAAAIAEHYQPSYDNWKGRVQLRFWTNATDRSLSTLERKDPQ